MSSDPVSKRMVTVFAFEWSDRSTNINLLFGDGANVVCMYKLSMVVDLALAQW